jgi:pyruvate-ferredoxin/flavodoxin oxidoreductase
MRLAIDKHRDRARELLLEMAPSIGERMVQALLEAKQKNESEIQAQRERVAQLKEHLATLSDHKAGLLLDVADYLVHKSVWGVGGDGWAYDIGFGGLDHVLASGRNINLLVLDTEVYSNTGGQMSKATPRAAVAKFAASGKPTPKKDLGLMMMSYRNVYIAQVAIGANDGQAVRTFLEAEAYEGPSLIIAYSHCIAHGTFIREAFTRQKEAVECGYWILYRYDPRLLKEDKNPLQIDSRSPRGSFREHAYRETRYRMLTITKPDEAERLIKLAEHDTKLRWHIYEQLASIKHEQTAPRQEKE